MVSVIKEICIFMIIAQAILFFVPGNSYGKYVRLLVGVMLILRITQPLFGLVLSEEKQSEIRERVSELEQAIYRESRELVLEDNEAIVGRKIEEEIKDRLEECSSDYRIVSVDLEQEKENLRITLGEKSGAEKEGKIWIEPVQVSGWSASQGDKNGEEGQERELRELYGSALGVEADKIEIVWNR